MCEDCAWTRKLPGDSLRKSLIQPTGKFIYIMNRSDYERLSKEDQKIVDGRDDIQISDVIPMEDKDDTIN